MSDLFRCHWSSRNQKVGRTDFIIISRYCGYESIFQKLTRFMEDELDKLPEAKKDTAN